MLDLAAAGGWTPALRTYARPAGATISGEDAENLARCIEAGLPSVDDKQLPLGDHAFGEDHTEALLSRRVEGHEVDDDDVRAAREILSGAPKQDAERLATFLKGGAFSVDAV